MGSLIKKIIAVICLITMAYLSQPKVIHVYHDKATTPALLQMINFINQSENDLKIVKWIRFHNHIKNKEKYKNTFFTNNWNAVFQKISSYKEKYKRIKIVVHYNIHHDYFFHRLKKEFENDIKIVHIYEDSSYYLYWTSRRDWILKEKTNYKQTLYISNDMQKLCSPLSDSKPHPRCNDIKQFQNEIRTIPVDFYNIKKKLSESDKKTLFELAGFDYLKYKKMLQLDKPTAIYVLGSAYGKPYEALQLVALKNLCSNTPNYQWFYKPHPNGNHIPTEKILSHLCPNIKPLDAYIPYELLILADLKPNKVAGMSSSLFFNQQPNDILAYIERDEKDVYLPTLKKLKLLTDDKIYSFEKNKTELKKLNIIRVEKPFSHAYWLVKINNTYCKMTQNKCGEIIEETDTSKTIQLDNGYILKLKYKKDYIWEEI